MVQFPHHLKRSSAGAMEIAATSANFRELREIANSLLASLAWMSPTPHIATTPEAWFIFEQNDDLEVPVKILGQKSNAPTKETLTGLQI